MTNPIDNPRAWVDAAMTAWEISTPDPWVCDQFDTDWTDTDCCSDCGRSETDHHRA